MEWLDFKPFSPEVMAKMKPNRRPDPSAEVVTTLRRFLAADPSSRPSREEVEAVLARWSSSPLARPRA